MISKRVILLICFVLASSGLEATTVAQQTIRAAPTITSSATTRTAPDGELIRKQLEEQATELQRLREDLKLQSDVIQEQQRQLQALKQKLEQADPFPVAANNGAKPTELPGNNAAIAAADTPAPQESPSPEEKPSVESGFGKIKMNGLLQGWFAVGNGGFRDTFRVRRAEMVFSGSITPKARWTIMFDLAKGLAVNNTFTTINGQPAVSDVRINQASRILEDAFISLDYIKHVRVNVGQVKIPLSLEALQSSAALDTIERTLFLSRGGLGDVWEPGVMFEGNLTSHANYQVGVFNGVGENMNDVDRSDQKALIGRFVFRPPFLKGLQLGGSGAWSNKGDLNRSRGDRLGGELVFERSGLKLKAEIMSGKDGQQRPLGYYTHIGYRFTPRVEGIFRFDVFDMDKRDSLNAANAVERDYIGGLNYWILENKLKFQANYLRKTFANPFLPARNLVLLNLQTSW